MKPYSNIYECNCGTFPHEFRCESEIVEFPTTSGGKIRIGPIARGESRSFEKNGHHYVVTRESLQ